MKREQEQPVEPTLRQLMNDIAQALTQALNNATQGSPERYGFALFMFGLSGNEACRMNYIANVNRQDMLTALKEFIARNEGTYNKPLDPTRKQ